MLGKTISYTTVGIEAQKIEVEVDLRGKMQGPTIMVGMPSNSVKESKERVSSAVANSGFRHKIGTTIIKIGRASCRERV